MDSGDADGKQDGRRYTAFLSYSHSNDEAADRLHTQLERYRIPKELASGWPDRRLGSIFRDRVDLASSSDLATEIRDALDQSDALILLCSPQAARSTYVETEICRFKQTGKTKRIFAMIVSGEPHAAGKPGGKAEDECFPPALLFTVGPDGRRTETPEIAEPIAADIREGKDGEENGALKIIAGLLGVKLDELIQRERQAERARRMRAYALAGVMGVLVLTAAAGGLIAWQQKIVADDQRREAEVQTAETMHRTSDVLARESRVIAEEGAIDAALLMALQADPAAQRSRISRMYDGEQGYPLARTMLTSAYMKLPLAKVLRTDIVPLTFAGFVKDGSRIVTQSANGAVRLWDPHTGQIVSTFAEHNAPVLAAEISEENGVLTAVYNDGFVLAWNSTTGALLPARPRLDREPEVAAISPDGSRIVLASMAAVNVSDAASGKYLGSLSGHGGPISSIAYSKDGMFILTASLDRTAKLWNATTFEIIHSFSGHETPLMHAAFSADGEMIVTGSRDGRIQIWATESGETIGAVDGGGVLLSVGFSPDGERVLAGFGDGRTRTWNVQAGEQVGDHFTYAGPVMSVAVSPDGQQVLTAHADGAARLWQERVAIPASSIDANYGRIYAARFSPDGKHIVTAHDGKAQLWQADTSQLVRTFDSGSAPSLAFSPDGSRFVTGTIDKAEVWETSTGRKTLSIDVPDQWINDLTWSGDGQYLALGLRSGQVRLLNASTGAGLRTFEGHNADVNAVAFSRDGLQLLAGANDGTAQIWNVKTGQPVLNFSASGNSLRAAAFSPDGRFVATGSGNNVAQIWDRQNGELLRTLTGHQDQVQAIAFSPDGELIVTGSDDYTVRLWSAATGDLLQTFSKHDGAVVSVEFTQDDERILAGSWDGSATIWKVPEIMRATPAEQVRLACELLRGVGLPRSFTKQHAQQWPVLLGEPKDKGNPELLVSSCPVVVSSPSQSQER